MFKSSIAIWTTLIVFAFKALKWIFIVGFVTSFANLPQAYSCLGWTPVSIMFGPHIYDHSLKALKLKDPRKHG